MGDLPQRVKIKVGISIFFDIPDRLHAHAAAVLELLLRHDRLLLGTKPLDALAKGLIITMPDFALRAPRHLLQFHVPIPR